MFNIGGGELLVIAIVALIVLGPDKLPQAARQAGRFMSEARKMSAGFRQELKSALNEVESSGAPATGAATPTTAAGVGAQSDDEIEAQARERGRQLAAAPDGAEPIGDQPVKTEPVEAPDATRPDATRPDATRPNGAAGNGNGQSPTASTADTPRSPEPPEPPEPT